MESIAKMSQYFQTGRAPALLFWKAKLISGIVSLRFLFHKFSAVVPSHRSLQLPEPDALSCASSRGAQTFMIMKYPTWIWRLLPNLLQLQKAALSFPYVWPINVPFLVACRLLSGQWRALPGSAVQFSGPGFLFVGTSNPDPRIVVGSLMFHVSHFCSIPLSFL